MDEEQGILLPGDVILREGSVSGAYRWELLVQGVHWEVSQRLRMGYESLSDALLDYAFRYRPEHEKAKGNCRPELYRSNYSWMFVPDIGQPVLESKVQFHKDLLTAISAVQDGEEFCRTFSEVEADDMFVQNAGIHRWGESAQRYEFEYGSNDIPSLLEQIRRGCINTGEGYDVFISHASEDKEDCVRPLARELSALGLKVWYDEFELKLGDSLRRSIDRGIATSRCGIAVVSHSFIAKNWTQYEFDGLVSRMVSGEVAVIPVLFNVDRKDVRSFSPTLADRVGVVFRLPELRDIAIQIANSLPPG